MSKAFYSWRLFCCNVCFFCHNCYNSVMLWLVDSALEMQKLRVGILAGRALKERQCMLEGQAQFVNLQGSVQCGGVHTGSAIFFN